jgi:hypothetical protein
VIRTVSSSRATTSLVRRARHALPLLALILAASPAAAATWSPAQIVSVPGTDAHDPRVGLDGAGGAVVVWRSGEGGVAAAGHRHGAPAWSAPVGLWAGGEPLHDLRLAVGPRGDAVAAWIREIAPDGAVAMAAIRRPGGGWQPPREIGPAAKWAARLAVAVDRRGRAAVVWHGPRRGGGATLVASRRASGAAVFGAPVVLSPRAAERREPLLVLDRAGRATAIWTDARSGEAAPRVVAATTGAGRTGWSAPVRLSEAGRNAVLGGTAPVAPDGRLLVTWSGEPGGVHARVRSADGRWGRPDLVVPDGAARPVAGGFDRELRPVLMWRTGPHTFRSVRGPRGWTAGRRTPVRATADPAIATGAGGAMLAVWQRTDRPDEVAPLVGARRADGRWTPPRPLAGPVDNGVIPCPPTGACLTVVRYLPRQQDVAIGPDGAAVAVWTMPEGDHTQVQAAVSAVPIS